MHPAPPALLALSTVCTSIAQQFYLSDDRLCYHEPDAAAVSCSSSSGSPTAGARGMLSASVDSASGAVAAAGFVGYYGSQPGGAHAGPSQAGGSSLALGVNNTASSLAALAAGEARYIALDRIPVRPLPHKQHALDPLERSHPHVGVALIGNRCACVRGLAEPTLSSVGGVSDNSAEQC